MAGGLQRVVGQVDDARRRRRGWRRSSARVRQQGVAQVDGAVQVEGVAGEEAVGRVPARWRASGTPERRRSVHGVDVVVVPDAEKQAMSATEKRER